MAPPPSGRHSLSPGPQHHCPGRLCPSPCGQRPCWGGGTGCGLCWQLAPSLGAAGTGTPSRSQVWPQAAPLRASWGARSLARASQREGVCGNLCEGQSHQATGANTFCWDSAAWGRRGDRGRGSLGSQGSGGGQGSRTPAPPQSGALGGGVCTRRDHLGCFVKCTFQPPAPRRPSRAEPQEVESSS